MLLAYLQQFKDKIIESTKEDALKNMGRWLETLLRRIHTLENTKLKKYTVKYLLKLKMYPIPMHSYFFGEFLQLLNTSTFYKEGSTHKTSSSVSALIPEFVKMLVTYSGKNQAEAIRELIYGIHKQVDNQSLLIALLKGLTIENSLQFITEKEMRSLEGILEEKTGGYYMSKMYKIIKCVINILSEHIDTSRATFNDLLGILGYVPTAFYKLNETSNTIEKEYKVKLLEILKMVTKPEIVLESIIQEFGGLYEKKYFVENLDESFNLILKRVNILSKVFGMLSTIVKFELQDPLSEKIGAMYKALLMRITATLNNAKMNPFETITSLVMLQKFIHYLIKLGNEDSAFYLLIYFDTFLASPLSEFLLNIMMQFLNPTNINPGYKDLLTHFIKHKERVFKLLTKIITLLHVYPPEPSIKLNKLFTFSIIQFNSLLNSMRSAKPCSSIALSIVLSFIYFLIGGYAKVIEDRSRKSVIVYEGVFKEIFPFLPFLQQTKFTEKNFDISIDSAYKEIYRVNDAVKTVNIAQWKIIKDLLLISRIDEPSMVLIKSQAKEIVKNARKNALSIMSGEMLLTIFDIASECFEYITIETKEDKNNYIQLITECWDYYQQDTTRDHSKMAIALFKLIVHPKILLLDDIKKSSDYKNLLYSILEVANKSWLLGRGLTSRLVSLLIPHPECLKDMEDVLVKLALSQEHRGSDNAIGLSNTFFQIKTALNLGTFNYEEIDFHGVFIRIVMFELFERLILDAKNKMKTNGWETFNYENKEMVESKFGKAITVLESILKMMIGMLDSYTREAKKDKSAPMTYTFEYRERFRIGQFVYILVQALDNRIFNLYLRKNLCESDPVQITIEALKEALKPNNVPILRHYIELTTIKLAEQFPDEVLKEIILPSLNDLTNQIQLRSAAVFMSCLTLDRVKDNKIREQILQNLIRHVGSHNVLIRTLVQTYILKYHSLFSEANKKFLTPYCDYAKTDLSSITMQDKIKEYMDEVTKMMESSGAKMILSVPLDNFGEFTPKGYIEVMREVTGSVLNKFKEIEGISSDYLWKEYILY